MVDNANAVAPAVDQTTSFINPSFFNGTGSEDARAWVTYLENWFAFKNIADDAQPRLFPLSFRNQAADWFESLEANERDTFQHLRNAFETRFFPTDLKKWQIISDIWSRKQKTTESVDEYVTDLLKMARIANIGDADTKKYAIIKGLRQEIRQHVLQQNPDTLAAVVAAAKVAEQVIKPDDSTDFIMAVRRLEQKIYNLKLDKSDSHSARRSQETSGPELDQETQRTFSYPSGNRTQSSYNTERRATTDQRQRSPYTPERRQMPDSSERRQVSPFSSERRPISPYQRYAPPTRTNYYDRARPQTRPDRSDNFIQNRPNWSDSRPTSLREPRDQRFSQQPRKTVTFQQRFNPNDRICMRCGDTGHPSSKCKCINVTCFKCGKQGHISKICQSGRMGPRV